MVATETDLAADDAAAEEDVATDEQADQPVDSDAAATPDDLEQVADQGESASEGPAVDVNVVFETAVDVASGVIEGSSLSPIEPTDAEPSDASVMMVGSGVALIDATATDDAFDASQLARSVATEVGERFGFVEVSMNDADEDQIRSLMEATTFKAVLSTDQAELGEIRLTVAGADPIGAAPVGEAGGGAETEGVEAGSVIEPFPMEEAPPLTERLPNLAAVDMNVSVELGRVRLPIRELLGLGTGSVIRLGTPIGESFDILVNGKPAARGDLVVVGGRLAVRIRELLGVSG